MNKKLLTLSHYYCVPEVQQLADYVGDSLELSLIAKREQADRIVFSGVKFMAETAKILNPSAEVILPDENSTCSLVTQTDVAALREWDLQRRVANSAAGYKTTHVMYINSSVEMKALADIIVTSRNVDEIVELEIKKGNKIIFSPDRNMGAYLNYQYGYNMDIWSAVCEVHDRFSEEQIKGLMKSNIPYIDREEDIYLIAHPESPLPVLKEAHFIGSTKGMLGWVNDFYEKGIIYVATEEGLLYNMHQLRPDLDIRQAPMYTGCSCSHCSYMKLNTVESVKAAQVGQGFKIDYISDSMAEKALQPIERMLEF